MNRKKIDLGQFYDNNRSMTIKREQPRIERQVRTHVSKTKTNKAKNKSTIKTKNTSKTKTSKSQITVKQTKQTAKKVRSIEKIQKKQKKQMELLKKKQKKELTKIQNRSRRELEKVQMGLEQNRMLLNEISQGYQQQQGQSLSDLKQQIFQMQQLQQVSHHQIQKPKEIAESLQIQVWEERNRLQEVNQQIQQERQQHEWKYGQMNMNSKHLIHQKVEMNKKIIEGLRRQIEEKKRRFMNRMS